MNETEHAEDHRQSSELSQRLRLLLLTGVVLVLMPCLGLLCGGAYLRTRQAGAFSRWRSLGAPPGSAVDIVTADVDVVYVRTSAGTIYGCRHRGRNVAEDCWERAGEPLSVDPNARFDQRVYKGEVQPPEGTVEEELGVTVWYAEDAFETRYVLLDDGSVWKWEYDVGGYWSLFILAAGLLVGAAVGIVLVTVIWALWRLRAR